MEEDRSKLRFRKNCEGYFVDKRSNILAKKMCGFLAFPGGGVGETESEMSAVIRETFEETGATVKNVKKVHELKFIWGPDWAKTDKQKERYNQFKGENMHFFVGEIQAFDNPLNKEEDFWEGEKLIPIEKAIQIIESGMPFDEAIKEYRLIQLKFLRQLQNNEKI